MFIPVWSLFAFGILLVLFGIGLYSLGAQTGYAAGLRAFYTIKDINNDLGRIETNEVV